MGDLFVPGNPGAILYGAKMGGLCTGSAFGSVLPSGWVCLACAGSCILSATKRDGRAYRAFGNWRTYAADWSSGAAAGTNTAGVSSKTVFVKGRDKCAGNRGAAGELWHGGTVVLVDKKGRKRGREKDRTSFKGVYV